MLDCRLQLFFLHPRLLFESVLFRPTFVAFGDQAGLSKHRSEFSFSHLPVATSPPLLWANIHLYKEPGNIGSCLDICVDVTGDPPLPIFWPVLRSLSLSRSPSLLIARGLFHSVLTIQVSSSSTGDICTLTGTACASEHGPMGGCGDWFPPYN